ncbi:hypothetical protein EOS93_23145 [Rhizobium sp. RMa-01]|uniref:hypothetical protein n=1 Tax=unclassified Rhizobium TaxID=2613769 RepID=UPI0008D9EBF7|nr:MULTISPECIES: hypothetical protein [unclassified Rhizobium]OHV21432.1 hypothetical protein BBJ66_31210 [Rhizobium sp. RSm-3]RVU08810.1 hypothetical protein EOS93_23145 [Rhizobium sp. RMa-01]
MKVTDATLDRILQRREKLERKGVIKEEASSPTAINVWSCGPSGVLIPLGTHNQPALSIVTIPSGKFLTEESQVTAPDPDQWARDFAHLPSLPPILPCLSPLIDAPPAPEILAPVIERVADATIGPQADATASPKPLAIHPDKIDREAVLVDLEAIRAKLDKPMTKLERIKLVKEVENERRQNEDTRPALTMALAPKLGA